MARPRIFISSTFYDLKQIRSDLEQFIKSMGYEPVLNERGSIPYPSKESLEAACYKEIESCDMLISVIGGRFGSQSHTEPYSISQLELKTAFELNRQVYVFVDRSAHAEYQTYLSNKDIAQVRYRFVDDIKIYRFLEEVHGLPHNNSITPFEHAQDIVIFLREQWAGLFQRFLQDQGRKRERQIISDMQTTAETLNQLVTFLTEEKRGGDDAIASILTANHPFFDQLRRVTQTGYRLYLTNRIELSEWLNARGYLPIDSIEWDDPSYEEWMSVKKDKRLILSIFTGIFDEDGKLKVHTRSDWNTSWLSLSTISSSKEEEEDLPF